jgi:short-subunit dehydrogenase
MKKTTAAFYTAQIAAGLAASAAAYALLPRSTRRDQVIVVTGGSRGLGFAIAERFARYGAKLVLCSRSLDELEQARTRLLTSKAVSHKEDVLLVPADLTVKDQASGLIQSALETFGRIDVLVNNAGIMEVGPVEDQPLEAYERAIQTNFFAALYTTCAALPFMLARESGSIANIASIGGKFAMPHMLPYVASKFALVGFSQGLHAELRHKGIRVTTVCPGLMRTGGEAYAHFVGNVEREKKWFDLAARTPVLAASVTHAARRIVCAINAGRAEITITPQAWLAARIAGLAPGTTQWAAGLVNHYILPEPAQKRPVSARAFWVDERQPLTSDS